MVSRSGFIIYALLTLMQTGAIHGEPRKHISFTDRKIKEVFVTEQNVLRSKIECIYTCSYKPSCVSVSWWLHGNVCLLSDRNIIWYGEENPDLEVTMGWVTMTKIVYPVILYRGPGGQYTMDYNAAISLCVERKTSIASTIDVLNARAMGYEQCACGWMVGQTGQVLGFVLQQELPWCFAFYNPGIIHCYRAEGDVYCLLK